MSSSAFATTRKYEQGVMKPTALETKNRNGKTFSRYYYKPLKLGELY